VSHDEFDNPDSAPVPPYERQWRHPSEFAAEVRHQHTNALTAPPLSKRIALASVTVSIICSVAILAVTIPKGVDRFASDDDIPGTTVVRSPMATKVKNAMPSVGESNSEDSARALAMGDSDLLIAPSDTVSEDGTIPITTKDGDIIHCHVIARDESTGLAILQIPRDDDMPSFKLNGIADRDAVDDFDINDLMVIEPITGMAISSQLSISTKTIELATLTGAVPLDVDIRINGISVVVNNKNKIVGVAFTRNHATWMLPMKLVRKLINDARAVRDELLQTQTQ
jgi:hypothetical protein